MNLYGLFNSFLRNQVFCESQPIPTMHHSKIVANLWPWLSLPGISLRCGYDVECTTLFCFLKHWAKLLYVPSVFCDHWVELQSASLNNLPRCLLRYCSFVASETKTRITEFSRLNSFLSEPTISFIDSVMFCPNEEVNDVITLSDSMIYVWDINSASQDCARVNKYIKILIHWQSVVVR